MKKNEVRAQIEELGIVPCARVTLPENARFAAETLYAAGIPVVEIPLTLPSAPNVVEDLAKRYPDLAVGAGTVLDQDSAWRCIDAGARFITSPGFIPEVVAYAKQAAVVVFPGA
jgi:2-dehydro-3-deoxyphosphogluconate aldolase/(4S)-4-hydroxy-2-oxoglutarate aldolase